MYVVSFYSYKGGVGRTASLLNTAWYLALHGRRVALLDLDLEAPGLSSAYLDKNDKGETRSNKPGPGFVELVAEYREKDKKFPKGWGNTYLHHGLGPGGRIGLLAAGDTRSPKYDTFIQQFSWHDFYIEQSGGAFMVGIIRALSSLGYEYLLIDARTGVTDVASITTLQLPDLVVLVTNLTHQSLEGIAGRLKIIEKCNKQCTVSGKGCQLRKPGYEHRPVEILLVASPLPRGEWQSRNDRIREAETDYFNDRRIDVEVDYLDLLAIGEQDQILYHKMDAYDLKADAFLSAATLPYQRLGDEIIRRNPESPENLVDDGKSLREMGLWRLAKAHHDEARERIRAHRKRLVAELVSETSNETTLDPTFQEADLGWLFADLNALNPDKEFEKLEKLGEERPANKNIAIERARAWLALAFPYLLLNQFDKSADVAIEAAKQFEKLLEDNPIDRRLMSLRALARLRAGYAYMLVYSWKKAGEVTSQSIEEYESLGARPLLLALAYCQQGRIALSNGDPMNEIRKSIWKILAQIDNNIKDSKERETTIRNQHVLAEFRHVRGLMQYTQGKGIDAKEDLNKSFELFDEDSDSVGQLDVLTDLLSLGMLGFDVDTIKIASLSIDNWIDLAQNLRMPVSASRLKLGSLGLQIAQGKIDDEIKSKLVELAKEDSQDPVLNHLARLELARLYLVESNSDLQAVKKMLKKTSEQEVSWENKNRDLRPQLAHPWWIIKGLFAIASKSKDANDTMATIKEKADYWDEQGYLTLSVQLRLVLALWRPQDYASHLSNNLEGLANADKWPWALPLAFAFKSQNKRLMNALKNLQETSEHSSELHDLYKMITADYAA